MCNRYPGKKQNESLIGETMKKAIATFSFATLLAVAPFATAADQGNQVKISGWVVDSACAYTKGIDKPISAACARACAKSGSPLVGAGG